MHFKRSRYSSFLDCDAQTYIYSYISRKHLALSQEQFKWLKEDCSRLDHKTKENLIDNDILIPEGIDEMEAYVKELLVWDKVTIVLDMDSLLVNPKRLLSRLKYLPQDKICLLYIDNGDDTLDTIKKNLIELEHLKAHTDKVITILKIAYLSLNNDNVKIFIERPSIQRNDIKFKPVYTHYVIRDKHFAAHVDSPDTPFGISNLTPTDHAELFPKKAKSIVKHKSLTKVSVVMSTKKHLKELPLSGFIIDDKHLEVFNRTSLHPTCHQCPFLVNCGGYLGAAPPVCPSYVKDTAAIRHQIKNEYTEEESLNSSVGVSNSLILKKEIIDAFDKMVFLNTTRIEFLCIKYLSKSYNRGFDLAKKKLLSKALFVFNITDGLCSTILDKTQFSYYYTQTFATSTKSYLKFKQKKPTQAAKITQQGIDYAVVLQAFQSTEVMGLFIAQMLMNMARVYRLDKKIDQWYELTMTNINFMLNFIPPDNALEFEVAHVKKIPDHLRYFMLIEIIDNILIGIIKNDHKEGKALIAAIKVQDLSKKINTQIDNWISLNQFLDTQEIHVDSFQKIYQEFMSSENDTHSLATLKLFIRNRIRKEHKQLFKKINNNTLLSI